MPDTPTFRELGHPEFTTLVWFGLLTQAATPKNIIQDMIAAGVKAQQEPSVREPLLAQGYDLPDESGDASPLLPKSIAERRQARIGHRWSN